MKLTKTKLKEIIREELLNEDDYASKYVDLIDDITKEVNRTSSNIVRMLLKQDKITGTHNARTYRNAVDNEFKKFLIAAQKNTSKIKD